MIKEMILVAITISVLLTGCSSAPTNSAQHNGHLPLQSTATNSKDAESLGATTSVPTSSGNAIDYSKYIKKVWVVKDETDGHYPNHPSFNITKIVNGQISGNFSLVYPDVPNPDYNSPRDDVYWGCFTGMAYKDTAECQFSTKTGDEGNIKLVFKPNDEIEASFEYKDKSQKIKDYSKDMDIHLDGTFQFRPYNLNNFKRFSPFEDQSFNIDLNSWGNVRFVSGMFDSGKHLLTVLYLTNKDGDILYDFGLPFPYGVEIKAVSFKDVNKDGLKDIIVIADCGEPKAIVYFQKTDGLFNTDDDLNHEINNSRNNNDIETITNYLSKNYNHLFVENKK